MDLEQIFDKLPPKLKIKKTPFNKLEPEEIFLDTQKDQSHKLETPVKKRNFSIFFALVILAFATLLVKAGWLQVVRGEQYKVQAERNSTRIIPIFSPRGIIYGQKGEQLVYNVPVFDLVVIPSFLPQDKAAREKIIGRVAEILGKTPAAIEEAVKKDFSGSFDSLVVVENIDREKVLILEAEIRGLPGFSLEKNLQREYVSGPYFSHILGYVGRMDEQDAKEHPGYFLSETMGKSGLEFQYEDVLRTVPGKKEIEVDALGKIKKVFEISETKDVKGIVLSIDNDLQAHLYNGLENMLKKIHASKASAVALDPRNGHVLALVSMPSFDNNLLSKGITAEDYKMLSENPDQPLFNRAASGQYAPGSTIKPFIGAVGLEEKIVGPNQIIVDRGALSIPNQYNSSIVYKFSDWKVHGPVNIYSAIAQSCNVFFYYLGGGYGNFQGLGLSRLEKYLKLFDFGELTGIDLPNEKKGFVPNAEWKKETKGEDWFIGDTYHLSIGQGDITTTPLRLAVLTAAIANGGMIWQPKVVDKIIDSEKNVISVVEPQGKQIDFISPENLSIIKDAMRQTVTSGSAQYLKDLPVEVAGKTGTAQTFANKRNNAWFTSFAPFSNPQIVITIVIEEGGEGSSTAAPVAKDILGWYFSNR